MTVDVCAAVSRDKLAQQTLQSLALLRGARIGRTSLLVQAADVNHAYRAAVVPETMSSDKFRRTPRFDMSVRHHDIMIAYIVKTALTVTDS